MDAELVSTLTQAFLSSKESGPFTSLRLWYEQGVLKYFFTNQPPRINQNRPQQTVEPQEPPLVCEDQITRPTRRTRKRKCSSSDVQTSTPENLRTCESGQTEDPDVSELDVERETSIANISCQNRFSVLAADDEDFDVHPVEPIHSSNISCVRVDKDLESEHANSHNEDINNTCVPEEEDKSTTDDKSSNRMCKDCKTVRVELYYHSRCPDCHFKFLIS